MLPTLTSHGQFLRLVAASFLAGGMNAMAGGGSFLSFPALMAMGVPAIAANATNTVALWPGQLASVARLRGDLRRDLLPMILLTSTLGGVGGAVVLLHTRPATFLRILPWMLLAASLLFGISGPVSRRLYARPVQPGTQRSVGQLAMFCMLLPVCLYVGYFGAGSGFLILSALAFSGVEEMHQLNSLKVLASCLANLCAVVTFIVSGAVLWRFCLVSMVFAAAGGYLGAVYSKRMNGDVLRLLVVVTGCGMAAYFFWRQP